ncbi:MAG: FHA domain-containing protein [Rhizobiaceae bacterium]
MKPELVALIGVIASSTIGGIVAFLVAAYKSKTDRTSIDRQINSQNEKIRRELLKERSDRKIDIAYKFAELNQKDSETAQTFMNEVAKETAIGFLYLNDEISKSKVWIRNDANILIGRNLHCDICLDDMTVSREHCVVHAQDNKVFVVPLNPTNQVLVDGTQIDVKTAIHDRSLLTIGLHEFIYFEL